MALKLEDLVYTYPDPNSADFQSQIAEKKEFEEVKASLTPETNKVGPYYDFQVQGQRFMLQYDRLLAILEPGVGKSCYAIGVVEAALKRGIMDGELDFTLEYLQPTRTNIKQVIYITINKRLVEEARTQILCNCTDGAYITEAIEVAPNDVVRGNLIRKAVQKIYQITTYKTFIPAISKYTDEQFRQLYSDTLFVLDEVHTLRNSVSKTAGYYDVIHRLLHAVERSKIMLFTATPMIDDYEEFVPIMNLILPNNLQLNIKDDYTNWTPEQFAPYFRGRIAYVRSLPYGVIPIYEGEKLTGSYSFRGEDHPYLSVMTASPMSEYQYQHYLKIVRSSTRGAYQEARTAAVFAPPPPDLPLSQVYTVDLPDYAPKMARVLELLRTGEKTYIFWEFLENGVNELAQVLLHNGFQEFKRSTSVFSTPAGAKSVCPSIETHKNRRLNLAPAPRFALITGKINLPGSRATIELYNSYENRHGEYIQILIGTGAIRLGINLTDVVQVHILGPSWDISSTYQAIYRAIRAISHTYLYEEQQAPVQVRIYQHVAYTPYDLNDNNELVARPVIKTGRGLYEDGKAYSIDLAIMADNDIKDIAIHYVLRIMKRWAWDYYLNYLRNVRPGDQDYSASCDYQLCQYYPVEPALFEPVDQRSYYLLYSTDLRTQIKELIQEYLLTESYLNEQRAVLIIKEKYPQTTIAIIQRAFLELNGTFLLDMLGFPAYINFKDGYIYLAPLETDPTENYYQRMKPVEKLTSLAQYTALLPAPIVATTEITHETISNEVEKAVNDLMCYPEGSEEEKPLIEILDYYKFFIYDLEPNPQGYVRAHTLYGYPLKIGPRYNLGANLRKLPARIRVFREVDCGQDGWSDLDNLTIISQIENQLKGRFAVYEREPFYGILTQVDDILRLVVSKGDNQNKRKAPRGLTCTTPKKTSDLTDLERNLRALIIARGDVPIPPSKTKGIPALCQVIRELLRQADLLLII